MFKSFDEIEAHLKSSGICKTVALAGAHNGDALSSVIQAKRAGIIRGILIGNTEEITTLLQGFGEDVSDWEMIEEETEAACAARAMALVAEKTADLPMKGMMQTGTFLRALFNKRLGLVRDKVLVSQATVSEYPAENRLMIISDCAINIAPGYEDKMKIIENTVTLANALGLDLPKVAVLAPLELVNPAMPSTVEAAMLAKAADRGQIRGCVVDGPLALDNAVSPEAAGHKKIRSEVAGRADILIMPDIEAGNIFTKALHYFANVKTAGTTLGPDVPVIMSSRTDTAVDKYNAILISVLQAVGK